MNHAALILASGSPRRRELLSLTGLPYVVDAPEVDESCALPPEEAVQEISRRKGLAGAAAHPGRAAFSRGFWICSIALTRPASPPACGRRHDAARL